MLIAEAINLVHETNVTRDRDSFKIIVVNCTRSGGCDSVIECETTGSLSSQDECRPELDCPARIWITLRTRSSTSVITAGHDLGIPGEFEEVVIDKAIA